MRITRNTIVAGGAVVALTVTLTACSGDGESPEDGAEAGAIDMASQIGYMEDFAAGDTFVATEPVEFGLLYRDHPNYPFKEDWSIVQHLEQDNNVTFDYENVPLEDMQQKRSVLIGSGEAPDIMPATYPGDEVQFIGGGAILPISDYVQYMPNFQQKVSDWGLTEEIEAQRQADGKYYMIPGLHEVAKHQYSVAIRQDLWDAAGLEHPTTWDEFAEQLAVIAEENPDLDHAMTDRWSINGPIEATMMAAAPNFGTNAGWNYGQGLQWDADAGAYEYAGASDEYRSLVQYFADLVADGLLDPEALTQDDDQAKEKFASGQAAAIGSNDQVLLEYRDAFAETGDSDAEIKQIVVPGGPAGDLIPGGTRRESGLMFSAQAAEQDDFLAMLQFVDWLYYSDEGLEFAKWGVEGETFERQGDERVLVDEVGWGELNPDAPKLLNADFGYYNGVWSIAHGSTEDLDKSMMSDEVIEFMDGMNAVKSELPIPPAVQYDEMQQEQAGLQQTTLQDIVMQNTAQFMLGDRPMSEWDAYVAELVGAGMTDYVDRANAAAGVGD
ncbi:carbohydrate ABC transporter substrate-binding protein (CUT1 family) [Isoptericola sp. CG 20/1183]|uniref:Carbohydrate ABC transporter substrate-binding protein (CUT1 family) n=1 Tax=Isoptericola halotolerans TaxID=300560 RepID=A0ABX5EKZ3_9MICO|nr:MULTISPECIES: extracellular solute-binding protein [Isoptericola]PRZ09537.1 carbohydrate ABC transporter substrate-binding protein (CUT1 family) [Isoptericola sp. CG 20/1183]PRZ10338.1 carbohydrate ABC transporter substrate-binding protein (CUT1 family) [Isoptericola halotolerans]